MDSIKWTILIVSQAKKAHKNLSKKAALSFAAFLLELECLGPYRSQWVNYTKMKNSEENYHCHIYTGKPTYVVCWRITHKKQKIIEVYYVGTHEKAPY